MGILNWCLYPVGPIDSVQIVSHKSVDFSEPRELPHGHPHASWTFPLCLVGIPIIPCGHSQWVLVPCGHPQPFFFSEDLPRYDMPCGHSQLLLYAMWAFPILTVHIVPHIPCGHQYALWAYPHYHQYAPWAFPILPCGHSHSHMPCGHSQQAPMPRGHAQRFLFQWRLTLPWHALWAFPIAAYMPCGHSQSWYFILCPIWLVVISTPCGLTPMATNMPCGHFPFCLVGIPICLWAFPTSANARGHFPFCPVGIPVPISLWAFPTSANVPWAPSTLSFSVKIYPAMTCPVGFPNGCLYARWAFPIPIFHTAPHMTCGHQYALLAYPHGHQYVLWAFPILPCGHSHFHMPCGIPNKGQCPAGTLNAFFFSEGFTCHDMPCRHSQLLLICPVGIPNPHISFYAPYVLWASVSPVGLPPWPPICPVGIFHSILPWGIPICPAGIPNKRYCTMGPRNAFFFSEDLTCHDMPCGLPQLLLICPVGIPNRHISHCAPYALWSSVRPVGLPPWPPICPMGISHSALWASPFP